MLSLARGSFWYKCPFVPLIVRNFSPHPPSPSSHTHFTPFTRTHTIPSYHEQVSYERRNHLRLFRLGLTRVLSFDFVVWMGHLNTIPNCHSGTYSIWGLTISLKIKNFSSWDSWKESVTVRRLQHLLTEATSQKSNLYPSQGEKECAACLLMIKLHIKDTCSDCYIYIYIWHLGYYLTNVLVWTILIDCLGFCNQMYIKETAGNAMRIHPFWWSISTTS